MHTRSGQCGLEHARCVWWLEELGRNGTLVNRLILSLVAEEKSKYGVQRGEKERVP